MASLMLASLVSRPRLGRTGVPAVVVLALVRRLVKDPSCASRSRNPLHSSARDSPRPADKVPPLPFASNVPAVGEVKMLFMFIVADGLLCPDILDEDDTRRNGESGTRRLECCAGLIGCDDAPGRARPAVSFCSIK